jgi:hypothetical protein
MTSKHHLPFLMLSYTARITFLVPLTGIIVLILYYNKTGGDTDFERFMSTQNFGVHSLFTLAGVGISFFWGSFFTSKFRPSIESPNSGTDLMQAWPSLAPTSFSRSPQPPQRSITLAPPLNAFSGIVSAVKQRNVFLVIVAFTAILS